MPNFNSDDEIVCVKPVAPLEYGRLYRVEETNEVGSVKIGGAWFQSKRFRHIADQPADVNALDYLKSQITDSRKRLSEGELSDEDANYEAGYAAAMEDMLEALFSLQPVTRVEFAPSDTE